MPKKRGKNKFIIKPIVLIGIVVFIICLVTCIYHIIDIRHSLEEEINQQLLAQLETAGEVLSDDIKSTEDLVVTIAEEMGEKYESPITKPQIYQVLQKYKTVGGFSQVTYVTEDSIIYFDTERYRDASNGLDESLFKIQDKEIYITNNFSTDNEEYLLLFVVPVVTGGERNGYIIGMKPCKNILDADAFSYMKKMGDVLVTDENGTILDCYFTNTKDASEKYDTVYDCMSIYWQIGSEDVSDLQKMIGNDSLKEGMLQCQDEDGVRYFYSFTSPEAVPQIRIISMYTENVYTEVNSTIVIGSIVFCVIIVLSMVTLVFYAYIHNSAVSRMIATLAYDDTITGGKNMNYFKEYATDILSRYKGMPFMIQRFDVSNFRYINEAYGHERADMLLKAIIEESGGVFYSKELCVRMNADQFVLLARNTQDLEERFFVFTDKVNARALDIGIRYPIKFKRGVYQIRGDEGDISLMIDKANMARKTLSGDEKDSLAYYSDNLANDMRKADKIESEMEAALFNGEFKMFIQPKWDIKEDKLYGGEALVRWMKEDGNMVYPSDFVPVFEKNGFIERVDMYMLEAACQMLRKQLDLGHPIYPISVNQSRMLLNDPDYINRIKEMLGRYNIPNGYIELEITETVLFAEQEKMISILNDLKAVDIKLSMDDFGSGYSSLNMLKDFPFDVLKIDKEFFSEATTSEASVWILKKIIEMAEGLGIRVICEGVETKEQVEMLQKIGCRYVQGYYYSKPIPAERFVELYCKESA
jgi:EAL domain-containing protein (putative c-di-GMP-specific phosphodiesterase class I)/GGDEF domain-containing protein